MSAVTTSAPARRPAQVRPLPHRTQRAHPGAAATAFAPGDFVLVAGRHVNSRLIRFGQRMRIRGADRVYVRWTHAALIVDTDGTLIEAVGAGVRLWHIDRYVDDDYVVVHLETSAENREEVVRFARWVLRSRARYSRLSTVSIALSMLTGSRLTFFVDGQFVCSGLVARALERTGVIFDRDSAHIAPADLAKYFHAAAPTHTAAWTGTLRTARTSSARERMPSFR
jgi:hypothetical protein